MSNRYRGIRLGIWTWSGPSASRYRIRIGRSLALVLLEALPRDWLDAYLAWYRERGWDAEAHALREQWLAARKVRV